MAWRGAWLFLGAGLAAGPSAALTAADLIERGYNELACRFDQRCVIGLPCERAWRDFRWLVSDAEGAAYRLRPDGRIGRKQPMMRDARWRKRSQALAILGPMREAVASHLTVFDGGGAIFSIQYAADPGSGQFFLGTCALPSDGTEG